MIENKLISIIVPAYNAEKWIKKCCESVFAQTYQNWELIVVNDGSTDRTAEILNDLMLNEKRMSVINTDNGGVSRARNIGLDNICGELFGFLDSDDFLVEDALEKLYTAIESNSYDIAVGWKQNVTENETNLGCPYCPESFVVSGKEGVEISLKDNPSMYAVWGKLFRRERFDDIRFVEGRRVHEDSYYVFQCLERCVQTIVIDSIVLNYRQSAGSASRSDFSDKYLDILFFAEEKRKCVQKKYPEYASLAENMFLKANLAILFAIAVSQDKKYRTIEKECIKAVQKRTKFFIPAIKSDLIRFRIVKFRLFWLYKLYVKCIKLNKK
jgi:glycosyltransferase involved in cell wall biosynthesis